MIILGYFVLFVYLVSLVFITVFCLMQLHLLYRYYSKKQTKSVNPQSDILIEDNNLPFITIQLPIYNEKYVVERLIDNILKLDYPKDKYEVQVLDDSTDDTIVITQAKVAHYKALGFNIECLTRIDRSGFKAGALKAATPQAKGEFIVIFDADFLPNPDFLKLTIPLFCDPEIGVVQTRWAHLNQHYSLLTEMQAFQLNVHFTIEQKGRYEAGYLLQFNGTAGVWRKSCIEEAGGWEADTLTEDLDLSYRAQLIGWKIKYLEDVTAPAELPAEINGLKSQQFRWMKGGAETANKMLPRVWDSAISRNKKIQATIHLLSSSVFIFVFLLGVFSVPLLFFINPLGIKPENFTVFLLSLLSIIIVYFAANVGKAWPRENMVKMILKFLILFPVFLALSMGLAFHNSLAVIQGWLGQQSAFVRTPKYGSKENSLSIAKKSYFSQKMDWVAVGEGLLSLYFLGALYLAWAYDMKHFVAMHILLALGYLILFGYAIRSRFAQ